MFKYRQCICYIFVPLVYSVFFRRIRSIARSCIIHIIEFYSVWTYIFLHACFWKKTILREDTHSKKEILSFLSLLREKKFRNFSKLHSKTTYSGRRWSWGEVVDPRKEGWWDNFEASVGLEGRASARWPRAVAPAGRCFRHRSSGSRFRATRRTPWPPTTRTWAWWGWEARRDPARGLRSAPRRKRSASATLPSPSAWSSARDAPSPSLALPGGCWSSVIIIRASFNTRRHFALFSKNLKIFLSLSLFLFFYSR